VVRVSRRVGAWTLAAVVTVALVAGGVLVAGGGRDRSPAVLPALDLAATGQAADGARAATEPAPAPGATEPAPAPGARPARPYDSGDLPSLWPPVTYRLKGPLPTLPDRAQAWRLGDRADAGRLAALAAALGLEGRPTEEPSGWTVRDGRRALVAHRLAGVPWSYGTGRFGPCLLRSGPYRPGGARCLDPDAPVSSKTATVAPSRPFPRPALPSRAEAERVARDLAARAGLSLDGAEVRVTDSFATRTVTIVPAVAGRATSGFAWTVGVGAKGTVQHASGYLATPEPADTYPLIGVAEGFERLKKAQPLGPLFRAPAPEAAATDPCPAGPKVPCAARPLPRRVATVTGVRLGLQFAPALAEGRRPAGVAYLLPAYLFDLEGGWTDVRAIIAVPDRYLTRP
jgi:hypothetical protein